MGFSAVEVSQRSRSVRLNVIGAPAAVLPSGRSALPRGRKAQAILCYLAFYAPDEVPRSRLVELLWSTRPAEQGRASLRQALMELRKALVPVPDAIRIGRHAVSLDRSAIQIDLGDEALAERFLEGLERLDCRFDTWIHELRAEFVRQRGQRHPMALPPGRRLLLSVEPMLRLGAAGMDRFVAPTLTQELVTALVRCDWLGVRCSPQAADCDYRVEGYLVPRVNTVHAVLRLVDQRKGQVIVWSEERPVTAPLAPAIMTSLAEGIIRYLRPEARSIM